MWDLNLSLFLFLSFLLSSNFKQKELILCNKQQADEAIFKRGGTYILVLNFLEDKDIETKNTTLHKM